MPTPLKGYSIDGEPVPSVTTIISRFKKADFLIKWAWQQGMEGKDYRQTSKNAADAGTCVHAMIECWKKHEDFDPARFPAAIIEKAKGAYAAFEEWASQTKLEIVSTEVGLVSRKYRFGGTLDAIMVQGKRALGDWKSSSGVYADYLLQLAAYGVLWDENNPQATITGGFHLLRFSKQKHPDDPVHFSHHYWSDLEPARKMFLLLREAYELDARVAGMV